MSSPNSDAKLPDTTSATAAAADGVDATPAASTAPAATAATGNDAGRPPRAAGNGASSSSSSSSAAGGGSASSKSSSSSSPWAVRVNQLQQARMTPELRANLNRRAEASRSARMTQMEARSVQMRSADVFSSVREGLRQTRMLSMAPRRRGGAPAAAGLVEGAESASAPSWGGIAANTVRSVRAGASGYDVTEAFVARAVEEEEERTTAAMSAVFASESAPAAAAATGGPGGYGRFVSESRRLATAVVEASVAPALAADADGELASLLEQLRVEPQDAEEVSAKFAVFETYMSTVVQLRSDVLSAVDRAKEHLEGAAISSVLRSLKALDAHEYLGAQEAEGVWIVYGMMKTASENHARLSTILRDVETKLALVAAEVDCPICLEPLGIGEGKKAAKLLACCHRTCLECWTEWSAAHPHPFCPLCRNVEFVEALARMASQV